MASYEDFLVEKKEIDHLIEQGYEITKVTENLSGAFVEFELPNDALDHSEKKKELHVLTADARKYFSNIIIARQRRM